MNMMLRAPMALAMTAAAAAAPASAQEAGPAGAGTFELGQIVVTGRRPDGGLAIGADTLGQVAMERLNRVTLDDAAALIPGVTAGNSGGSRNERLLFVRGFDRFQVPLSIDGIRVYLPADNRLDYGRFLTPDVAEIQVAKGYASVLDGPGAMGGAVNLVTRKPTRPIEAEVRGTLDLDQTGDYAGYTAFGLLGTRQDRWYAQASFARTFRDHWDLPGDFAPTVNEDGGARDFSRTADWRLNAKLGFTPNATDEYALSYTRQEGSKNAPLHVTDTSNVSLRNWKWPEWNIQSVYFLSTTALGDRATLRTRAYYNEFYNLLQSFDNRTQASQRLPRSFDSPYDDHAYGGSAELGVDLSAADRFTVAFHYRRDVHKEAQSTAPDLPASVAEPVQTSVEQTWSAAAENRLDLTPRLRLTIGGSYDWRELERAEEFSAARRLFSYPLRGADGWNAQGRLDWQGERGTTLHASVSSRIRFPTLFERFSSQFGTAEPNPDLEPERATNFEVGGTHGLGPVRLTAALFYSHLDDALVSIRTAANLNRRANIGSADYYGGEISLDADLTPALSVGGNYGYIHRDFDIGRVPAGGFVRLFRLTDVPAHKGIGYASWRPVEGLTLLPTVEFASKRTTVTAATASGNAPVYYRTGGYVTAGVRVDYAVSERVSIGAGARNILGRSYTLTDGFPEAGRSFFATATARY